MIDVVLVKLDPEEPESLDWVTEDEIAFVRLMYKHRNIVGLQRYRRLLQYRVYHGPGMFVNREYVRLAMNSLIDALEQELLG